MKITESRIRRLIRQVLLEKLTLPHPDEIQRYAYKQLMQGKSIKDIFPNHDRESLNNKIKLLYNYIKEKELPMPKIIGGPDEFGYIDQYARAESENISHSEYIAVMDGFLQDVREYDFAEAQLISLYSEFQRDNYIYKFFSEKSQSNEIAKSVKTEFENLSPKKQADKIDIGILSHVYFLIKDMKNRNSLLRKSIGKEYKNYKVNPTADYHTVLTKYLEGYYYKRYRDVVRDISSLNDYIESIACFGIYKFVTSWESKEKYGIQSLKLRTGELSSKVEEKATSKRIGSQRKVMTQLKDIATEQIKGDVGNWFAVHYSGAFSEVGKEDTYLDSQTSFIESFGGPGGISNNEYAAVPYPKSAKKLNDSLAAGKAGSMFGVPKIGMVLNGTVTSIYSDDVHSDTFSGFKNHSSGIGQLDQIDSEEGFVRFPGGEQTAKTKRRKAASKFKAFDKHIVLDLEKAENDIKNAADYPGKRGYYECFIDDWYVDGIVCNWKEFINKFPKAQLSGPDGFNAVFNFLKTVKEKKIKIYDENFDTRMIGGFNGLVDVFTTILDRQGIMKFQEKSDGSLKHPLEGLKNKLGKK